MGSLERELFFDIFLLFNFFSVVFELGFKIIDFGDEFGFFVVAQSLVFLFEEVFLFFLEKRYFLMVLFFHFRDEFVLHVDLFFGHLFQIILFFLDVFLDF